MIRQNILVAYLPLFRPLASCVPPPQSEIAAILAKCEKGGN